MKLAPSFAPQWLNRDAAMIILARGIRTFAQGFVAVLLALYLTELGFGLVQIGAFLGVGVLGVSFFAFLVSLTVGKVGRRRLLILFATVSGAAGLALILFDQFLILLIVAFVGSLSTGGGGGGESPAQPWSWPACRIPRRTRSGPTFSLSTTSSPEPARPSAHWRRACPLCTRAPST